MRSSPSASWPGSFDLTPSLPDIIAGAIVAVTAPAPPEAAGDYMVARLGMVAMLGSMAVQEVERGGAARAWENAAMRRLFDKAGAYDEALGGALATAAAARDAPNLTWSELDAVNAGLRRLLIALHEEVERRDDQKLDREILDQYRRMAHERRLDLPSLLGG